MKFSMLCSSFVLYILHQQLQTFEFQHLCSIWQGRMSLSSIHGLRLFILYIIYITPKKPTAISIWISASVQYLARMSLSSNTWFKIKAQLLCVWLTTSMKKHKHSTSCLLLQQLELGTVIVPLLQQIWISCLGVPYLN